MKNHSTHWIPRRLLLLAMVMAVAMVVLTPAVAGAASGFTDIDNSIFKADIEWMAENNYTTGCNPPDNDEYCPEDQVTRGQMAAFLARSFELTEGVGADLFTDDDNSIFEDDIDKIGTAGITTGCNPPDNDKYCPNAPVTRGQMAAFLNRALGLTEGVGADLFTDDDNSIFEDDIDKIGTTGITRGCNPPDNDNYCPQDLVTRGQMAAFLNRALNVELQILAFNDYHGHVSGSTSGRIDGEPAGGGQYLSTKLTMLREGKFNSLSVAAGDLIGGSPAFSGLFHDEPSVETLNYMGLDVSGVGNHEFDEGVTELLRMQDGGCHPVDGCYFPDEPYPGADFPWLAANVMSDTTGETPLPPYWVTNVGGADVGFIGMTLEATDTLVAAAGIKGWEFKDEVETANALVPILKAEGVETIIVLLHEGGSQTPPPGDVDACVGISGPIVAINDGLDAEIDAVITGHTHLPYNCMLDDPDGNPRFVSSAYSYGRVVTEMNLMIDPRTGEVDREASTAVNHAVIQADDETAGTADGHTVQPDPGIDAIIARWQPLFDEIGLEKVGEITADINRGGDPTGSDRGVESAAGNLVADAQLYATEVVGAEIAFMNPGGVRSDLTFDESGAEGDGVVTYGEAFTFQPFSNTLVTMEMTGAQIMSVLEEQCQPAGSSRPILHLGVSNGFTYDLSTTVAAGDCTAVTVANVELDGAAVTPAGKYKVTMNSFLADGGDNFTTFADVTTDRVFGVVDLEALNVYLTDFAPVDPPGTDRVNELAPT